MEMSLSKLEQFFYLDKLTIHSLDLALYQASVEVDGERYSVMDNSGKRLVTHSLVEMQKRCRKLNATQQVLRHESAYDEMVGGPEKGSTNALEVPLKDHQLY